MISILWDGVFSLWNADICEWKKLTDMTNLRLSLKELQILRMIADGKTSPQIAEAVCLSLPTVKWYRKRLKTKLDVATTIGMVRKAISEGLL